MRFFVRNAIKLCQNFTLPLLVSGVYHEKTPVKGVVVVHPQRMPRIRGDLCAPRKRLANCGAKIVSSKLHFAVYSKLLSVL